MRTRAGARAASSPSGPTPSSSGGRLPVLDRSNSEICRSRNFDRLPRLREQCSQLLREGRWTLNPKVVGAIPSSSSATSGCRSPPGRSAGLDLELRRRRRRSSGPTARSALFDSYGRARWTAPSSARPTLLGRPRRAPRWVPSSRIVSVLVCKSASRSARRMRRWVLLRSRGSWV